MKIREIRNLFENQQAEDTTQSVAEETVNEAMALNGKEVNYGSLEIDGVDSRDYPDFSDAYFSYAEYTDGTQLTDEELEQLTNEYGDVVNELAHESSHGMADDAYDRWKDSQYEGQTNEDGTAPPGAGQAQPAQPAQMVKVPSAPKSAVKVGGRTIEFNNDEEAKHFMDLAKLGGIKIETVSVNQQSVTEGRVMKNHMDETEYTTYSGWKSACRRAGATEFEGDKDICQAKKDGKGVGEWDGAVGTVYDDAHKKSKVSEKAVSQQQQKFMGMVHAMQKGEKVKGASKELKKVAKEMPKKAAKDFASTKHKGLPKKVKEAKSISEGIEAFLIENDTVKIVKISNMSDFDLDQERGIDRIIQDIAKDSGASMMVDPVDTDASKVMISTTMTDDELLNMLDQNGIDAEIEQQGPTEVGIEMPQESVTEGVLDDTDDSGFMAKSNLYKLIKNAIALHKIISDDEQLEGWVEEKITLSNDYINTVRDYLEYNMVRGAEEPASAETAPMASPAPTIKHVDNLSSSPAVKNPLVDSTELDHILKLNSRLNK